MAQSESWLRRISRRDFLEGVLVAGAGASLTSCVHAPSAPARAQPRGMGGEVFKACHALGSGATFSEGVLESELHDVVVLGAGLSGLCAAWALKKSGVGDVVLLDKEPVAGGEARALQIAGKRAAAGAAYSLTPWGDPLFDFYRALGVVPEGGTKPDPKYLVPEPANRSFYGGRWIDDAWNDGMGNLPLESAALADLKTLRATMLELASYKTTDGRPAFETPVDDCTHDEAIRALDRVSFAAWVASRGWRPEATAFFDPYCRSALGMKSDEVSAWAAINFLQAEFGPTLTQPGGTAWLAEKLVALVGAQSLKLGRNIVRVVTADDGVRVTTTDVEGQDPRTLKARRAIFALPKYLAPFLLPQATAGRCQVWSGFAFGPYIVANLAVSEIDRGTHYDNWLHRDAAAPGEARLVTDFIVADAQERKGATGPGVLTVYCPVVAPFERAQVLRESFDVWAERIVSGLAPAVPSLRERLQAIDLFRWGHAVVLSRTGFVFGPERTSALIPLGAIHFANTDVDGSPSVEGALLQGLRAAKEAATALGRKS